jgi:SP family xylose:H+ symportor-like MFS transporter
MGRKKTLMLAAGLFFVSALGSGFPEFLFFKQGEPTMGLLYMFNFYRIIGGIGVGLASAVCPMYIGEVAPADIRGRLVSINQFAIIFGMLVVYFVNYFIAQGKPIEYINETGWRLMFLSEAIPAAIFGVLLFFVPETPRYLALTNKDAKALQILAKINGIQQAQIIMTDIKKSVEAASENLLAYGKVVIVIGILLSVFQQFVGINVALYYAPRIFESMGAAKDASMLQTVVMGLINVIFTVVAILTVDKYGRKPLLMIGSIGMAIGMFAIGGLDIKETFGDLLKRLPNRTEVAALLVDISQQGLGAGLEFELFKPGNEQPADFYVELPIQITVVGTYHEFGQFISGVSDLPRIVTNHNVKIAPQKDGNLLLQTTAKTYRYMDEEEEEEASK